MSERYTMRAHSPAKALGNMEHPDGINSSWIRPYFW